MGAGFFRLVPCDLGGLFLRYLVAAVVFHIQRVERFCRYSHNIMFRIVYY